MKKMVLQILEKAVVKKTKKIEEHESQVDEPLGDLNPRYFEEAYTLEEAKNKIYSARNPFNFRVNLFGSGY